MNTLVFSIKLDVGDAEMTSERTTGTRESVNVRREFLETAVVMSRASARLAEMALSQTSPNLAGTCATAALELAQGAATLVNVGTKNNVSTTMAKRL